MKKTSLGALLLAALSSQTMAADTNLDVTFTATLRETTCDMAIEGGTGSNDSQTFLIGDESGKTTLADIINKTTNASTSFKLKITECPSSLTGLKTTISGTKSGYVDTAIVNALTTGKADYTGVSIARATAPEAPFTINSSDDTKRLVWSDEEITSQEVVLVASLVETKSGLATAGNFSAIATFNFEYQ
ncbi:fimbrial protein [Salmonella enterica subsp. enterica]|nr:fimbrial protein [Salmonella enterica subsp. enterica]EAW9773351.1 fimbrial protein [Salmonella enterica]EDW0652400.1 fimbrial protein [Salmonella enterica subsp. enterica serovar Weslaco]EAY5892897.1 fimbrial protein [Salmonella enterica]EBK0310405.1 fimbrial protein [Salmonella enterica]